MVYLVGDILQMRYWKKKGLGVSKRYSEPKCVLYKGKKGFIIIIEWKKHWIVKKGKLWSVGKGNNPKI